MPTPSLSAGGGSGGSQVTRVEIDEQWTRAGAKPWRQRRDGSRRAWGDWRAVRGWCG